MTQIHHCPRCWNVMQHDSDGGLWCPCGGTNTLLARLRRTEKARAAWDSLTVAEAALDDGDYASVAAQIDAVAKLLGEGE